MDTLKKIFDFLEPNERKKAYLLLILILFTALLDMLGVASILPFITVLSNPELIETNKFLNFFYHTSSTLGVVNTNQFLFGLGILVFLLLILSLILRGFTHYALVNFALLQEYKISGRLVEGYLRQPYEWFLRQNSADLGKGILSEVNLIIYQTILPILNLISQITLSLAILVLIFVVDPIIALSLTIFLSISYGLIFNLLKKTLTNIGDGRLKSNKDRFVTVMEAFKAVKEIKVNNLEDIFIKRFKEPALIYAKSQSLFKMISDLPRFVLEGVAFGGMIFLVLILMLLNDSFESIVPIIALYAFAGYRLIPAIQQIYSSFTQIRFSKKSLDILHSGFMNLKLTDIEKTSLSKINLNNSIKLSDINFSYGNNDQKVLKDINLKITAFSKVAFVGATGSGKTTIVDLILGLLIPKNGGTLSVDKSVITENNKRSWQRKIGYVPQQIFLADASIATNIAFGIDEKKIDYQALHRAAKIANLHDFIINELPNNYNTIVGEHGIRLSGGQRQRIGIARALYHRPELLILDEATSSLDNLTEQTVMEMINNLDDKITIILIAHRLSTVKNCDNIFLLDKGQLKAQGTYNELKKSSDLFQKLSDPALLES